MAIERSDKLFEAARDAQQKFDYFVLGIIGALCAFIGQSFKPDVLGLNPSTLEFASMLMLVGSAVAGFLRVERTNQLMRMNAQYLRMQEERGMMIPTLGSPIRNSATGEVHSAQEVASKLAALDEVIPTVRADIDKIGRRTLWSYRARNWLLLTGFLTLLLSRVWAAYT